MGRTRAVAYEEKSLFLAFEVFVKLDARVIELDLGTVEQVIEVCGSGDELIKRENHLDDGIERRLGHTKRKVAGGCIKGRAGEALQKALGVGAAVFEQVAETLYHNAACQHIGKCCYVFTVGIGILERFGELMGYEQGKVGVCSVECGVVVAVSVDRYDAVGILGNDLTVRVHTEGAADRAGFGASVHYFALVNAIGYRLPNFGGTLETDADINAVVGVYDAEALAKLARPFGAAATCGDDDVFALDVVAVLAGNTPAVTAALYVLNLGIIADFDIFRNVLNEVFENEIIAFGSEMSYLSVEHMQVVLQSAALDIRADGRILFGALAAKLKVDFINVFHKLDSGLFADVLVKIAAEVIGYVIFSIRKCTRAADAGCYRTMVAADAVFYFFAVYRAVALLERCALFEQANRGFGALFYKFISGKKSACASAYYCDVIFFHNIYSPIRVFPT